MPTILERLATLEADVRSLNEICGEKFEEIDNRMNQRDGWLRFLISQAIQAVIVGTTIVAAIAAIFRHGG